MGLRVWNAAYAWHFVEFGRSRRFEASVGIRYQEPSELPGTLSSPLWLSCRRERDIPSGSYTSSTRMSM